ncbi:MAG: hypothetical protein WHS65_03770 [Melioribacteraceae bacterium]
MDASIINLINELVIEYKNSKNPKLLEEIELQLKLLEYQSLVLKYKLRIVENPNLSIENQQLKEYECLFGYSNAYSKYHLIMPLMIYLFVNHKQNKPALETALNFMKDNEAFLKEGDFAKTKTGVQRFITNTRFASLELRRFGLLRSDDKHYYHTWELSLFGILIAGSIYFDYKYSLADNYFKTNFDKDNAYLSFQKILHKYTEQLLEHKKFYWILNNILEDEVIVNYLDLYERKFLQFASTIMNVLKDGYKLKNQSTQEFINMLNNINADREISKLADSIVLKKNIEVNLNDIFEIINK